MVCHSHPNFWKSAPRFKIRTGEDSVGLTCEKDVDFFRTPSGAQVAGPRRVVTVAARHIPRRRVSVGLTQASLVGLGLSGPRGGCFLGGRPLVRHCSFSLNLSL